ncbi:hypothetical protein [Leucobacter komagatae]|uniref:hypothetical protein n=1 Tax=Leucobacter komagatae TaxID=55969 RepID=UPI000695F816|nr:hypothetical protein [Leucobacter komagatae]
MQIRSAAAEYRLGELLTPTDPLSIDPLATVTHVVRASGAARVGPVVALGIAAAFAAMIAFATGSPWAWLSPAALLLVACWWLWAARIEITITNHTLRVTAPAYRRSISRTSLTGVSVARDDGMNPSILNWPVVPLRSGDTTLIRVNMGGTAAVTCHTSEGSDVQVVVNDIETATRIAGILGTPVQGA